jgi:aspartokinase-like uncharacterized kinase
MAAEWIVVKVGGSLFDLPDLRARLRAFLASLGDANVLIVPGGGATADAIRALDRAQHLGEEASHWLAIQVLSLNARFLHDLLPEMRIIVDVESLACASGYVLLDALPFFQADEMAADHLPHRWEVTSDSLAVRAAVLVNACELIVLKSVAWRGCDWAEAARVGIVDGYFPQALQQAPAALRVRIVNVRAWP